jgi:hypothetical protein
VLAYLRHEPTQVGAIPFSLPSPENDKSRTLPLISPDGRLLAFSYGPVAAGTPSRYPPGQRSKALGREDWPLANG